MSITERRYLSFKVIIILFAFAALLPSSLSAQFYFGRNKIQYKDFDWQVLTTPHFQIFYYSEEEDLARAAAFWAEEFLDELEIKFNYVLPRVVPLVIYSNDLHFQQTNTIPQMLPENVGGFFDHTKGRVVLPSNGSLYNFRRVVRHELVHVFTFSKLLAHGRDLGVWERRNPPAWFSEGLADWWSEGWDSQAEMVIRDALLNGHLIPLENLSLGAGYLLYKEGQSFMRYFEEVYGVDRIRLLMEEFYHYDTFGEVMTAVTKVPYKKIANNWRLSIRKAASGALNSEAMPNVDSDRITGRGANISPAYYQDAEGKSHILYLSNRDGYTNIYRQAIGSTKATAIIKGEKTPELESMHFLQSGLSVNDNNVLAFAAKSFDRDRIRLVDLDTMIEINIIDDPELTTIRSPAWSADGKKIVFTAQNQGGDSDLYLWQMSDQSITPLTNDVYVDLDPIFGPRDSSIIFSSDRNREQLDGSTNLFYLDLRDSSITQFTSGFYRDQKPKLSLTDPGLLRFVSDRSGTPNIWEYTMADSALRPLTDLHTGAVDFLDWNRDSLLITAFDGYNFQLHLIPIVEAGAPQRVEAPPLTGSNWRLPKYEGEVTTDSHPYRLQYTFDLAQTAVAYDPTFGFIGGAQVALSDMLGNRYYHILVANTAQTSRDFASHFNFAVSMANLEKRINHSIAVFRFANEMISFEDSRFYFEQSTGVRVALNYPLNIFNRVELSSTLWQSDRDYWATGYREKLLLVSTFASLVKDNSLWSATGPVDGLRFRVTVGQTYDLTNSGNYNHSLLLDNRIYIRFLKRMTFAQRSMLWYSDGKDVRQHRIGGSWGIRGYEFSEIKGRRYAMFNQELRFPFARSLVLRGDAYAVGMAPLGGALFLDVGNAWNDKGIPAMIGSYGFGIRALFMGALVLRWDFGKKTDFHSKDTESFTKFFFGWDY